MDPLVGIKRFEFRSPAVFQILIVALAAVTTAFSSVGTAAPFANISAEEAAIRVAELTPKPWDGQFTETVTLIGSCIVSEIHLNVTDPRNGETWPIHTTLYRPNVSTKVPMSLIIPTIDGVTVLEPSIANQLCNAKIGGMIAMLHDTTQPAVLPAWGHEDVVDRREILGLRTLLDFGERDPRFDRSKLGIVGLSLGAVITSLMVGLEPDRLRASVIAVGAGNLPYVLAMSDNDQISMLRKRRMQFLGINDLGNYQDILTQNLRYDPLFFASRVKRDRIMMVMSTVDTKVIAPAQRATFDAFNRPEYMLFNWGHISTLVQLAFVYFDPVIAFMQSRFDGKVGASLEITPQTVPQSIPVAP